jgi:hypothetical protein
LQYVEEWSDEFLALFPHRFDYIYASHPEPGQSPHWQTESRHPLGDRLIQKGTHLYGVRFGSHTQYLMLDIDSGSPYHPQNDPFAIARINATLESLGLVTSVACSSSYSNGIHLYFPFDQPQPSWAVGNAVTALLENSGFIVKPGLLEVFPNRKLYSNSDTPSLFNAHRLPMQAGSYLLDGGYSVIWSDRDQFVQRWQFAQRRNSLDKARLETVNRQNRQKNYRISGKTDKFINDLNTEIEIGWTDYGQTNRLLGRIAMREYIFHHVLEGGEPLEGQALVDEIVRTARSLPGYSEWCRHQYEIEKRAAEWARCIENSHYFHYSTTATPVLSKAESRQSSWNAQRSEAARDRIVQAIQRLVDDGTLPGGATARFKVLTACGIGGSTLYRYRELWHPAFEGTSPFPQAESPVENPPLPPNSFIERQESCAEGASSCHCSTSLLPVIDRNLLQDKDLGDRQVSQSEQPASNFVQRILSQVQTLSKRVKHRAQSEALNLTQRCSENQQTVHLRRMQQYLDSGDPILVAEAMQTLRCSSMSVSRGVNNSEKRTVLHDFV